MQQERRQHQSVQHLHDKARDVYIFQPPAKPSNGRNTKQPLALRVETAQLFQTESFRRRRLNAQSASIGDRITSNAGAGESMSESGDQTTKLVCRAVFGIDSKTKLTYRCRKLTLAWFTGAGEPEHTTPSNLSNFPRAQPIFETPSSIIPHSWLFRSQ